MSGTGRAQQGYTNPDPIHLQCAIDAINSTVNSIYHQETESQCIAGTWHNLTYIYTFGNKGQIPLMDVDTGMPCACPADSSGAAEDNCDSPDAYDDSAANDETVGELLSLLEGSSGPNPFVISRPALMPLYSPISKPAARPEATATTPAPYAYTLPYRALGSAPLLTASLPGVAPTCLASANPTHFEVAHIDGVVKKFNSCTGALIATINVQNLPLEIRVTPDGTQAIVTNFANSVSFINTATNQITKTMPTPDGFNPSGIAISPDGTYALITNLNPAGAGGAALGVINIASQTMTSTINLDTDYPRSVFITPDATLAWVNYPFNGSVEVIDLLTGLVVQSFNFTEPLSIAINDTGTVAYIATALGVKVIDTRTYTVTATVQVGSEPSDLLLTRDGAYLVVNNSSSKSISVIDTKTLVATTQSVAGRPRGNIAIPVQ
jgi:YVTN family beta-propeller protein